MGLVGVGSNNSRGTYDNAKDRASAPSAQLSRLITVEDFTRRRRRPLHLVEPLRVGGSPGQAGRPSGTATATSLMTLPRRAGRLQATVRLEATVRAVSGGRGGLVFDFYTDTGLQVRDARFRGVGGCGRPPDDRGRGRVEDARFTTPLSAGVDYRLNFAERHHRDAHAQRRPPPGRSRTTGLLPHYGLGAMSRTGATPRLPRCVRCDSGVTSRTCPTPAAR